jgi:Fe-S-cluster containining protein
MPDLPLTADRVVRDLPRLGRDDTFTFRCGPDLDCFTQCCQDVSIVLTPYDVLRLTRALGLESGEFLERHTISPFTPEQKIPVALLRMDPETKRCPFVSADGCGVYRDRPWACRIYPLGLAEPKRPSAAQQPFHFLVREDFCHGHGCGAPRTVRQWTEDQGLEAYDMMGRSFTDLMLHDFWDKDEALAPDKISMYYTACYDLDGFRRFVFETRFLELFEIDEARVEALRTDDQELLDFAMQWLRFSLFGERTMRIKDSVARERRQAAPATAGGLRTAAPGPAGS